jgi:hypothetical protein
MKLSKFLLLLLFAKCSYAQIKVIEIGTCFILIKLVNWLYGRTI